MNQHASKKSVPPSVGADVSGIETLLNRNLPEVFGEGDPARRRAAIQELYTEDCVLCVPPGTFVGHDALDKFAGELRATHPHYVYTPHGAPQVLHNSGRLAWGSGPKGEAPQYTGVDFIIARDGKIAALALTATRRRPYDAAVPERSANTILSDSKRRLGCSRPRAEQRSPTPPGSSRSV